MPKPNQASQSDAESGGSSQNAAGEENLAAVSASPADDVTASES